MLGLQPQQILEHEAQPAGLSVRALVAEGLLVALPLADEAPVEALLHVLRALGECLGQHRVADNEARDVHESQPVMVAVVCHAHHWPPPSTRDCGSR